MTKKINYKYFKVEMKKDLSKYEMANIASEIMSTLGVVKVTIIYQEDSKNKETEIWKI